MMFWRFVRKELLTNLMTMRLVVALVFTVVLSSLTTLTGSIDYGRNYAAYQSAARQAEAELEAATVYQQVNPRLVIPPQPLSILARGVMQSFARQYVATVNGISIYAPPLQTSYDSQFMKMLAQIDFTTVVGLLLSFLAVVLAFDGICGERQQGTLRMVLAQPVPRGKVVLAKLAGGVLTLTIPFAAGFGISLLIMLATPHVALTGGDWVRLAGLLVLSVLFLSQVYGLSLMVSTLTRDSDTALIVCLFAWLVSGVGYLNALPSLSRYGVETPPNQVYMNRRAALWEAHNAELRDWQARNPPPGLPLAFGADRGGVQRYGHPQGYEWLARREQFRIERRLDMERQMYEARWAAWKPLADQALAVDEWSVLSPISTYQVLAQVLAGTTLDDLFRVSSACRDYTETLVQYLRGKGAFGSWRWFTDDPPGQEPLFPHPDQLPAGVAIQETELWAQRVAWMEEQDRLAAQDARRHLDLSDLPSFGGRWRQGTAETLQRLVPGLAVLLLTLGASVLATVARFMRYDPT